MEARLKRRLFDVADLDFLWGKAFDLVFTPPFLGNGSAF
jgi:hypothetical protein